MKSSILGQETRLTSKPLAKKENEVATSVEGPSQSSNLLFYGT